MMSQAAVTRLSSNVFKTDINPQKRLANVRTLGIACLMMFIGALLRLYWLRAKEPYLKWKSQRASDRLDRIMQELRHEIEKRGA